MKCLKCGHEPQERQPKFCSECGYRLLYPEPSTLLQDTNNNEPPGREEQSVVNNDEPQPLMDTGPPTKKQKKKKRKKSKKKGTNSEPATSFSSLPANMGSIVKHPDDGKESDSDEEAGAGDISMPPGLTVEQNKAKSSCIITPQQDARHISEASSRNHPTEERSKDIHPEEEGTRTAEPEESILKDCACNILATDPNKNATQGLTQNTVLLSDLNVTRAEKEEIVNDKNAPQSPHPVCSSDVTKNEEFSNKDKLDDIKTVNSNKETPDASIGLTEVNKKIDDKINKNRKSNLKSKLQDYSNQQQQEQNPHKEQMKRTAEEPKNKNCKSVTADEQQQTGSSKQQEKPNQSATGTKNKSTETEDDSEQQHKGHKSQRGTEKIIEEPNQNAAEKERKNINTDSEMADDSKCKQKGSSKEHNATGKMKEEKQNQNTAEEELKNKNTKSEGEGDSIKEQKGHINQQEKQNLSPTEEPLNKNFKSEVTDDSKLQKQGPRNKQEKQNQTLNKEDAKNKSTESKVTDDSKSQQKGPRNKQEKPNQTVNKEDTKNKITESKGDTTPKGKAKQQDRNVAPQSNAGDNRAKEQKHIARELDPANLITVYFHVIVSKKFNLKPGEDNVVVQAGNIKGFAHWKEAICNMNFSKEIKDHGFLYEGQTRISKENVDKCIPYKYVIVRKNKEEEYEYIFKADVQGATNRCLFIRAQYMNKEWHQYDDVCMKENKHFFSNWKFWEDKHKLIYNSKIKAGEVMLSSIFSVLAACDEINLTNFFNQLNQFYIVSDESLVMEDRAKPWTSHGFNANMVCKLILDCLNRMCEPFINKRPLQQEDVQNRLTAGLVCLIVANQFSINISKEHLASICTVLCLDEMPREKMIAELQAAKNLFSKYENMETYVRQLCYQCVDQNVEHWVWVLPVLHTFSSMFKTQNFLTMSDFHQEDVWAGLEGIAYHDMKRWHSNSDLLSMMIKKKHLLQADPILIRSWLCLIPINHMAKFLEELPIKIDDVLKACCYRVIDVEYSHKQHIEEILKKLLHVMGRQDKITTTEAFQKCTKASLSLHNRICSNQTLRMSFEIPSLSAEVILTLLKLSDLPVNKITSDVPETETELQKTETEIVLQDALMLTKKWIENVYGHSFNNLNFRGPTFDEELRAWNRLFHIGENVTPKWKDGLLPMLKQKIKQEEAFNQILIYCKKQHSFEHLHPSIGKCFEDCAIGVVHLACQSEDDILSKLSSYNLENFGRLVSSVIKNSWPKDGEGNYIKDEDTIFKHLLEWRDALHIFKLYGTDSRIISQFGEDIQELVAISESVFVEARKNVMDGEILFKHMECILENKKQFLDICKLKIERNESLSLMDMRKVLTWRKDELDTVKKVREWVDSLLKMVHSVQQTVTVNISDLQKRHAEILGPKKLSDILLVGMLDSSPDSLEGMTTYYELDPSVVNMAECLHTFRNSFVFITCWERQAQELANDDESSDDLEFTIDEMVDKLFTPCLEQCTMIYNDLKSGEVAFEVVDRYFGDFKNNYKKLQEELKILCHLGDADYGRWTSKRVEQIEQYHQLHVAFRSAKVIWDIKDFLKLSGNFETLERLLDFAEDFENYKTKPLSYINKDMMETRKLLSEIEEDHIICLQTVLFRKDFFHWVKEALEDVNELKVFVDLASISAGENDMDVDRVACFHDAVLGYSSLLYEVKPEFTFADFMESLNKLWKALKSDQALPKKLRDSARHIEWLKTVKESHGSVELSSLSLATTINNNGIYVIKAPRGSKKITPDTVLQLILPENEAGLDTRIYTLEELKELLNKLMLMSGKGDQGNLEVDKFSEIFSNVQRLSESFIHLYLAGNMLFRTWEAKIFCKTMYHERNSIVMKFDVEGIDELEGQGAVTDILPDICKTMEMFLEEWLTFINRKRSQHYFLSYYTAEQVVYLCQQYQERDISEEALVMLSFIKPDCAKIDTIKSFYFTENQTPKSQPDLMEFASNLCDCRTVSKKLELVWKFSMDYFSSLFPGCLDIDTLGKSLAALARLNKKPVIRDLHPSLQPGRPNLILCSPSEILSCALAVYMHSSDQPLPSYDEVLLCSPHTTFEEVALFLRRCLTPGYSGNKIYSLIYADQLSYDVGYKSEQLFQQLQTQGIDQYYLVVICNSDREHCYIPSVFSQFKVHLIPQQPLLQIQRYLCTHFRAGSDVVSASSVFKNGMSAGIVSSKRAGVGKSLYVKRLYQKLLKKFPREKPLLKIIRLIKTEVDENEVLETLLPYLDGKLKGCPIIFHIDITSSVKSGISEFLFKLLVLHYLMDSEGRIWKRLPSHLYIIEILESPDLLFGKQFKSVPRMAQNNFIDFFPKILCCSPKEVMTRSMEASVTDCGDPGMDIEEFHSECFQRPYQYLIRFDQKQNLDTFVFREGHVEGDPAKCLQIFLLKCGIVDPSWSELRNFAWFLNLQLKDCESSVFCNHEHVGDTLQGFKNFVVDFMILMAKDFSTPSLHIADQSPGRQEVNLEGVTEQDLAPFLLRKKWETEPHPYIFFNDDHISMTFIGFHLRPNNAGGVDAINPRTNNIIRNNIMSMQLYEALVLQRVPFNIDFDQLPRHEKISRLCMVLGIQWPIDPDETYELTMDNILKILAIKMRFRCGIPVVIMGETGCGKTRLVKFLCHLCKGFVETENMKLVKVHGGTTAESIYQKILEAQDIAHINKEQGCETILFFDEANTTEAISSIKEALCDHTVKGVPLKEDSGLQIIAACNPYRKHTDDMIRRLESAGLGYRVKSDETKDRLGSIPLRQLVYRVHALPPSMMPLVWDFGQLNNETEKKYIQQIVHRLAKEIKISSADIALLTDVLSASQSYMRKKNDECSFVSLRDVERCIEVFKWFYNHHEKLIHQLYRFQKEINVCTLAENVAWSLVHAVGVCYHASLETKDSYRRAICRLLPMPYRDPSVILRHITAIQDLFLAGVQLRDTIAKNQALKENLFMMVICIELKIPLFLVGKPGSSKSLAKTIVADAMQGQAAHTDLYKDLKQIHLVSFQCSPHSTPEGIIGTFRHCARFQEGKNLNEYVSVVVLDEIGLAEDSPKMPLKTLHPLLEDGCIDDDTSPHKKVGFIGISNWALDPAKMNRGIFVSRGDPNRKELIESAKGICSSDNLILHKISRYFHSFSEAYLKVCETQKEQEKEFFGLRDFYSLIKMVFAFTKQSQGTLTLEEIARAVLRNFSGKDELKVLEIFLKEEENKTLSEINTIDLVMENVKSDSDDCRYLLILTKNYAALQILQQAFLREGQQPEIIFGSSFPKDQEYTQICRNINRVKNCMETGKMVILLNLQNLYESLYDALNQYYVYLAGQKYVDLGLGTHRVKCRVHPKFRLIVIEEKEVVYKDFPIPLINRLEKHYLDMNTFLKREHRFIVQDLEEWVKYFTKGNPVHHIGKSQTYSPSDVFIGYHSDTCASVVLQVTENMSQSHLDAENTTYIKNKAKQVLLSCATPDSVIRLGNKPFIDEYFKKQKHGSFLDFLCSHVSSGCNTPAIFTEITTFSRLLTSADKKVLEAELLKSFNVSSIEILSLQQFDTEFSFLKKTRSFLENSSGNLILIVQSDFEEGSQGANLVASAKYSAVNEINKVNLTGTSVFVYYITKLPRMQGGTSYVGFRGGLWQSIHIDDLRKPRDMVADVTALTNLTISQLFYAGEKNEQVKDDARQNIDTGTGMEVEMTERNEENEIQPRNIAEESVAEMDIDNEDGDLMETEDNTIEDQEMEADVPQFKPEDMLDTTMLIRSCIQNAIGLLRDDNNVESRSTKRIEILINLLTTEDDIKRSFIKMLKLRLHNMLKIQEANTFQAGEWVIREAANQEALQEAGTFRQTLWKRVQAAITPLLSQILSVVDRNANLDLLVDREVHGAVKCLWMYIFHDETLLPIANNSSPQDQTILVRNYMNISVFGENCLPFSWRIKDYLEDIWTQAQHIGSRGPEAKYLDIFSKTTLGKYICSQDDDTQDNLFLLYKRDFILMTMSISSADKLQVMEFALSACIEELRSSLKDNGPLLLPWVHVGYSTFQHRLQNLNRILTINPSVVNFLLQKIRDSKPNRMALDIYAAIASLETLKQSVQSSDPQDWMQQVKNIQVPTEVICSEGYLQGYSSSCEQGIKTIRKYWTSVFSMALFMDHLLEGNLQDAGLQGIITENMYCLGRGLGNFVDLKSEKPLMVVVDVLHKCRHAVANSVSRYGMQVCAICRDDPTEPVCLGCNHVFCQSCLKQWLGTGNNICPMCKTQLPEPFIINVSPELRDAIQKNKHFRNQCNGFFVDVICNLCFKDNKPPEQNVVRHLISFLFGDTDSGSYTRSLSPFEDAVDKTPVIRSVILKLLLKYSFENIMDYAQEYFNKVKESNLFKIEDSVEVYLLFLNCLEDSLFEKKQKVQSDKKDEYFNNERLFLHDFWRNCRHRRHDETSVQFLQEVARVRLALDMAAEMLSAKPRGPINDDFLTSIKNICSQSGNDWYRIYLIRKLANIDGIDMVQQHFKDPSLNWLFPQKMLQNQDTETSHIDPFLVCGQSYKVLRDGVGRAMIECKQEWLANAIQECQIQDQELAIQMLLAVFREITLYYGHRNNIQVTVPEHETVKTFIKNTNVLKDAPLNQFVESLLNNNRPFIQAVPGMRGSHVTVFGLAIHMAATLLSGNNHLFAPLKTLSFSPARMQNSFLPTMPEDMLTLARGAVREQLHWYVCQYGHYFTIGECGQPMQIGKCPDCGVNVGGENHQPLRPFQRIEQNVDRTQTGHVLGDPERQGQAIAPDRDIAAPAFILLRMITHLSMLLGSEEDIQSQNVGAIVKPRVQNVAHFLFRHIERDLENLRTSLGKSADETTTIVHLVIHQMLRPQQPGHWPVNFDEVWSTKEMRNNWEKHFASIVIAPVLRNLDRDLMTVNNYISQDERISSNPIVKVVYGDPLRSGEEMDLPRDSSVYCSKIWSCRERISIEYLLHILQQQDGKDNLPLLWKFLEKEYELQLVKFLPNILKLQKELVKRFQNYRDINFQTIGDFLKSMPHGGAYNFFETRINEYMLTWNRLRLFLQTNGEIKLPESMCDQILTLESHFEFLLPRRQGLGLAATALTSYLIALHNSFIYALERHTDTEQKYSIKATEVLDLHVISYEMEKDLVPIILSNCHYSLESGKETFQEFDFSKIQHQITARLLQGKPLITMDGLPTLTLTHDRKYENLFTDVKKKLPQDSLSNSAIDVISKDLNAFSDVCEALNIVDILLGFLATSGGDREMSLTKYVEDVLQMGEQSSAHVIEALKRCYLKNTIAVWQLLTALKSQHLLHLKRDPFADVDKAYKQKLDRDGQHALNIFLEQNGTNLFLLELHEMIMLKLRKSQSADDFPPSWLLKDVLGPLLDEKDVSFPELERDFPNRIALAHCIEAWKVTAAKKWNRI